MKFFDYVRIVVRSSAPIERGEMLCMTYTYTFSGTLARQEHLKEGKYFTCQCVRCLDPTELGTFFSSINCQKCGDGNISPLNPLGRQHLYINGLLLFPVITFSYFQMLHLNGSVLNANSRQLTKPLHR